MGWYIAHGKRKKTTVPYKVEVSILGSWASDVYVISAIAAKNCTLNIYLDSERWKNNFDITASAIANFSCDIYYGDALWLVPQTMSGGWDSTLLNDRVVVGGWWEGGDVKGRCWLRYFIELHFSRKRYGCSEWDFPSFDSLSWNFLLPFLERLLYILLTV